MIRRIIVRRMKVSIPHCRCLWADALGGRCLLCGYPIEQQPTAYRIRRHRGGRS